MNNILERIREHKLVEIHDAKRDVPQDELLPSPFPIRDFQAAILSHKPAIIAEIKKASPSKGILRSDFDVASIAETYEQHGASCLSVLTDVHFFQGDPSYIHLAKAHSTLPVLRKDFIIDAYQIHESLSLGADCILLIVALLEDAELLDYCQQAQEMNMSVLVESHTQQELERALKLPTPLMGINNRNLQNFITSLKVSMDLSRFVPKDKIIITESGIHHQQDLQLMKAHGIHSFLIGESLMQAADMGRKLDELILGW